MGVLIEEPFPMLALDELCKLAHSNIKEAMMNEEMIREQLISKRRCYSVENSPNGHPLKHTEN